LRNIIEKIKDMGEDGEIMTEAEDKILLRKSYAIIITR